MGSEYGQSSAEDIEGGVSGMTKSRLAGVTVPPLVSKAHNKVVMQGLLECHGL